MILASLSNLVIVVIVLIALPIVAGVAQPYVIWAKLEILKSLGKLNGWRNRAQYRFKYSGTFAWMFAWYKMRMDPMFIDLPEFIKLAPPPRVAMDLGCGYGVAGNVLLEWCPDVTIYGLDPNPRRVKAANRSFTPRGQAFVAGAPDFEVAGLPAKFDTAFCLDMIHYLTDAELATTFNRLHGRMETGGFFFLRSLVPPTQEGSFLWRLQVQKRKHLGGSVNHRSIETIRDLLIAAGFTMVESRHTTGNPELHWFIAKA